MIFANDLSALIAEIDSILTQSNLAEAEVPQAQVLAKVHRFLLSLQRQVQTNTPLPLINTWEDTAQQVAQAVIAQMQLKRTDWLDPLQTEVETLRQQKQDLIREIRQLEIKRQDIINDFVQVLLGRCSDSINQKMAQMLENLTAEIMYLQTGSKQQEQTIGSYIPPIQPQQRLENLQRVQQQADQLLINLDATLRTVFESLERDLQAYQASLAAGLAQIHHLGEQGEAAVNKYIKRLNSNLQEPLTEVKPEQPLVAIAPARQLNPSPEMPSELPLSASDWLYPFAGIEIVPPPIEETVWSEVDTIENRESSSELIQQLLTIDLYPENAPETQPENLNTTDTSEPELETVEDFLFESDHLSQDLATIKPSSAATASEVEENPVVEIGNTELTETVEALNLAANTNEEVLFAGLSDPAQTRTVRSFTILPQSRGPLVWQEALFADDRTTPATEVSATETIETREELNTVSKSLATTAEDNDIETIQLLTDLLRQGALNNQEEQLEENILETRENLGELSSYLSSQSEETLLPTTDSESDSQPHLASLLAPSQIQQLDEDLERFETNTTTESVNLTSDVEIQSRLAEDSESNQESS